MRWWFRQPTRLKSQQSETAGSNPRIDPAHLHRPEWQKAQKYRQPSDRQAVFIIADQLIVGQMLVNPWQGVEIGKHFGELAFTLRDLAFIQRYPLKAIEHRPAHRHVKRLAGTFGQLPDQAVVFFVFYNHGHRSTYRESHLI